MNVETITHEGALWAVIIRKSRLAPGIYFATEDANPLQVGKQLRTKGTLIKPHAHCAVDRPQNSSFLQEVLYIEKGVLKVVFYTQEGRAVEDRTLNAGDAILLVQGGHGFEALEEVELLEVKMGPYDPASKKNIEVKP